MTKRKREENDDTVDDGEREAMYHAQNRFRDHFGKSLHELTTALKLARGFERQKMGRRQKQASNEPQTLLRLREEVIILKQLDVEKTAKQYLLKYLGKIKRIKESSIFIGVFGQNLKADAVKSGAEANVLARLCKSAPVKEAVDKIVESTYAVLGIQPGISGSATSLSGGKFTPPENLPPMDKHAPLRKTTSPDASEEDMDTAGHDRMAVSHNEDDNSFASFDSGSLSRSMSPVQNAIASQHNLSTLLDMGGYYSGSDDGESEPEREELQPRKNRRGQRARQQLAELKYGKNAKHLQGQQPNQARGSGWDAKRGAVDAGDRRRGFRKDIAGSGRREGGSTAQSTKQPKPKTRDDTGPIHPSWQAAKQRQQGPSQSTFAGKKTSFD
jgi:hypothetical protein